MNKVNLEHLKSFGAEYVISETFDKIDVCIGLILEYDTYVVMTIKGGKTRRQLVYTCRERATDTYLKMVKVEKAKYEADKLKNENKFREEDSIEVLRAKMDKKASSMGLCGIYALAKVLDQPVYDTFIEAKKLLGKRGNWKGALKTSEITRLCEHFGLDAKITDISSWCRERNVTRPTLKMFLPRLKKQLEETGVEKIMILLTGHAMFYDGENLYDQSGVYDNVYKCRFKGSQVQTLYRF